MNLDSKTLKRFQWLRFFCLLAGTILLVASFFQKEGIFHREAAWVLALFWLETFLLLLATKRFSWSKILVLEISVDFLLVNVLIWLTGGRESPFIFLYPLLVFVVSLHFGRKGTDLLALATLISFALIFWGTSSGLSFSSDTILQFFVPLGAIGVSGLLALRFSDELARTRQREEETRAALFRAEELHRHIMRSLASGLIITDLSGKIVSANHRAREILAQPLVGQDIREIFPDLNFQEPQKRCEIVLQNGGRKYLGYSLFPLKDEKDEIFGYGFLFQDITQIKEQEERLQRAEHLAALGTMASGLVHEVKNPLASICGAVQLLKERGLVLPEGERLIRILERETSRLDKLVSDFLLFARPTKGEVQEIHLRSFLEEIYEDLRLGYPEKAFSFRFSVPEEIYLAVEPGRLKQVLLNLFLNSLEASSHGLEISIKFEGPPESFLEIKDNAGGIPQEILRKIFEPFFTTKPEGTGLGLSVVHSLIHSWGGRIEVSNWEEGAVFRLYFPPEMILRRAQAA